MPTTKLNLNIIPALTIEQIQIGYALLSATIPNLKSFIMSFDTAMMMDFGDYKVRSAVKSRSPIDVRSNRKSPALTRPHRYSDMSTQDELIGRLRPERLEHRATAHHVGDVEAQGSDLPSAEERESQDKDIRLDMQWKIEEEFEGQSHVDLPGKR